MEWYQPRLPIQKSEEYKLKDFMATKPELQHIVEGLLHTEKEDNTPIRPQERISHTTTVRELGSRKAPNTVKSVR